MTSLFEEYGGLILSVIALALLLVFLFSDSGFLYQMADRAPDIQTTYTDTWKADELEGIISQKEPDIHLREQLAGGEKAVYLTGTEYDLADLIWAQDESGQELEVLISDVKKKESGQSIFQNADGLLLQEEDSFIFSQEGFYEIEVIVIDRKNIITRKTIDIPVKKEVSD